MLPSFRHLHPQERKRERQRERERERERASESERARERRTAAIQIMDNVKYGLNAGDIKRFIAVDVEGEPSQEIAAIAVNANRVESVFHIFPRVDDQRGLANDWYARKYIHGLPISKGLHGVADWRRKWSEWRSRRSHYPLMANAGAKEAMVFNEQVINHSLQEWVVRATDTRHIFARYAKQRQWAVGGICCAKINHCKYVQSRSPTKTLSLRGQAKAVHGYHCALYDAWEVAMDFVMDKYSIFHCDPLTLTWYDET